MISTVHQAAIELPTPRMIARGFAAAHGVLLGAVYLALLYAPLQVVGALANGLQGATFVAGQEPQPERIVLSLALVGATFVLTLTVFFLFPFIQGGILGQVRDRLQAPHESSRPLGGYGRAYYVRLLGSQGLFALVVMAVVCPIAFIGAGIAVQQAGAGTRPLETGPLPWRLLSHPLMLAGMVVAFVLLSAVAMVYWVASCIMVAEQERVVVSWRRSLHFCRVNLSAILAVWLVNLVAGIVLSPIGLLGQLGIVTAPWGLSTLALLHSALIGYWGVVLAGLSMSLYLDRREDTSMPEGG